MFNISEISKVGGFLFEKTAANKIHYSHGSVGLQIKGFLEQERYTQGYV
jgi:hypothetical protein